MGIEGPLAPWSSEIVLDCAHNVEGLTATGKALAAMNQPLRIVYGTVADKDVPEALGCLPPAVQHYWCAADVPRALAAEELSHKAAGEGRSGLVCNSVKDAVHQAIQDRQKGELVAVLGSVFTVGEALSALESERGQV